MEVSFASDSRPVFDLDSGSIPGREPDPKNVKFGTEEKRTEPSSGDHGGYVSGLTLTPTLTLIGYLQGMKLATVLAMLVILVLVLVLSLVLKSSKESSNV